MPQGIESALNILLNTGIEAGVGQALYTTDKINVPQTSRD